MHDCQDAARNWMGHLLNLVKLAVFTKGLAHEDRSKNHDCLIYPFLSSTVYNCSSLQHPTMLVQCNDAKLYKKEPLH